MWSRWKTFLTLLPSLIRAPREPDGKLGLLSTDGLRLVQAHPHQSASDCWEHFDSRFGERAIHEKGTVPMQNTTTMMGKAHVGILEAKLGLL